MNDLLYHVRDSGIAEITLNRPEAHNAYSEEMVALLIDSLDKAERDPTVKVVIITGAGSSFCAGGDLKAMKDRSGMFAGDPVELRETYRLGIQGITRRFSTFEKPTIAALNGAAIGAGLGLALMCDLRVSSENARFGSTFTRVGLVPGDGSAFLLTRVVGFAHAIDMILTARIIDAQEAKSMNLVHRLVPEADILAESRALAIQIAGLPDKAVRAAKTLLYKTANQDLDTALHLTLATQGLVQSTDDHLQAVDTLLASLSKS